MKPIINLDVHSAGDYVFVATALAAPYALGFSRSQRATNALRTIFLASACKDLLTRYRYSLVKKIPIGPHLAMDCAVGAATAAAPFVLGFRKELKPWQTAFFVGFGLGAFAFVALTSPKTERGKVLALRDPRERDVRSLRM